MEWILVDFMNSFLNTTFWVPQNFANQNKTKIIYNVRKSPKPLDEMNIPHITSVLCDICYHVWQLSYFSLFINFTRKIDAVIDNALFLHIGLP